VTLSFDTCILIDILRARRPDFRDRLSELIDQNAQLNLSVIAFHELDYGARISARPAFQLTRLAELTAMFTVQPWTADDAMVSARVRADLKARGQPIESYDTLIAGQALARGWSVVTANVMDFGRIDGLTVIDWSSAAAA
jgi:tRNA(fMet)-specific endonuclease VapC